MMHVRIPPLVSRAPKASDFIIYKSTQLDVSLVQQTCPGPPLELGFTYTGGIQVVKSRHNTCMWARFVERVEFWLIFYSCKPATKVVGQCFMNAAAQAIVRRLH
jgi:hypothetical protein